MSWIIMSQYFKIIKRTVPGTISATCLHAQSLVCVRLLATPWTVACQVPLSMGFPGKNTRVGYHFLLQGIFLTLGSKPGFLHCKQIVYHLSHQGSSWWFLIFVYQLSGASQNYFYQNYSPSLQVYLILTTTMLRFMECLLNAQNSSKHLC